MIITRWLELQTKGNNDVIDLTTKVRQLVEESKVKNGLVTLFVSGSTAGLTTIENEAGLLSDLKETLNRIIPQNLDYKHNRGWEDNAHAHLRASLWGPSLSIPIENGSLLLGTWQQVFLIDFDTRPRSRKVIVQIIGE